MMRWLMRDWLRATTTLIGENAARNSNPTRTDGPSRTKSSAVPMAICNRPPNTFCSAKTQWQTRFASTETNEMREPISNFWRPSADKSRALR
eukprot:2245677-Rhodomonas_salina.1